MDHSDHIKLLKDGIHKPAGIWADLGSGTSAFTLALADLLNPEGSIYSIDKDRNALQVQERAFLSRFSHEPSPRFKLLPADFTEPIDLPALDGAVMANVLHFYADKGPILHRIQKILKPDGRFILIEYNVDRGNRWVPHPLSFESWKQLAQRNGFTHVKLLETVPSSFLGEFYSTVAWS